MRADTVQKATAQVQLLRAAKWEPTGACFKIPAFPESGEDSSFYVTAFHTIREKQDSVSVLHWRGAPIPADVVGYDAEADLAVLSTKTVTSALPLFCAKDLQGGELALLGYPRFTKRPTFTRAEWRQADEDIEGAAPVIAVYSEEISTSAPTLIVPEDPHALWRGLSGGPCLLVHPDGGDEYSYAIGVVTSSAPKGAVGRLYCASIEALDRLCGRLGLVLEISETRRSQERVSKAFLGEVLSGLYIPQKEQQAWASLSNTFFHETAVLSELSKVRLAPGEYSLTKEDAPFVDYFIARLLLKKGKGKQADEYFKSAVIGASRIDSSSEQRLNALIAARRVAEQPLSGGWQQQFKRLRQATGTLEDLGGVPDSYKYVELTSLTGWQATKLFLRATKLDPDAVRELTALARGHRAMLKNIPEFKARQEVVSTALEILANFWDNSSINAESVASIEAGFVLSRVRHNSIFFIQMLMARAICHWQTGHLTLAVGFAMVISEAIKLHDLGYEHEGIGQFKVFSEARCTRLAAIMATCSRWSYNTQWRDKVEDLVLVGLDRSVAHAGVSLGQDWINAMRQYTYLYDFPPSVLTE